MGNNSQKPIHTVEFETLVVLLGGANVARKQFNTVIDSKIKLICADGGANLALNYGVTPDLIVGDMDSFTGSFKGKIIHLLEQDTTDFEKCLYTVEAPLYIGLGFLGGRVDHELAVLSTLVRYHDKSIILVGEQDICFCCPKALQLELPIGTRLSVFPMDDVKMGSSGLEWPLDGVHMSPTTQIGTSNRTTEDTVKLYTHEGHAIVILPIECLDVVKRGLTGW